MNEIEILKEYQEKILELEYISNILNWELYTKAPKKSLNRLIDVKANNDLLVFKLKTDPKYIRLLNKAINSDAFNSLSEIEQRYIYILKKNYDLKSLLPEEFYKEYQTLCSKANIAWGEAKKENNYEIFKPYLKELIEKTKQKYKYLYPNQNTYDAMLNEFETGMTSKEIDKLFNELKGSLIPIIKNINNDEIKNNSFQDYTETQLMDVALYLLDYIGFDLDRGALGIYSHGFTAKIGNDDVRIAFKKATDPIDFVTTIIHEGGHGIFEQNIDKSLYHYTITEIENLYGLHESQSRFYENILGRNINFWLPIYDDIKKMLNLNISIDEFVSLLNNPKLGLIRTEADELTYCLHIIVRYEIEREIFNNNLSVDNLPKLWNDKMQEYLGIVPTTYSDGILQDVHWSQGSFGYFPSYLLGNIYDGMFKEQIEKYLGNIDDILKSGNIKVITNYLINNIYKNGGAYTSKEIIEKMCQKEITSKPIIEYFENKYATKKYTK